MKKRHQIFSTFSLPFLSEAKYAFFLQIYDTAKTLETSFENANGAPCRGFRYILFNSNTELTKILEQS